MSDSKMTLYNYITYLCKIMLILNSLIYRMGFYISFNKIKIGFDFNIYKHKKYTSYNTFLKHPLYGEQFKFTETF